MTVRFTYRESTIRIIGAGCWRKGKRIMSAKIKYTNEPLGKLKVVPDFLPKPEDLVLNEEGVKVTLALSRRSVTLGRAPANARVRRLSKGTE